MKKIKFSEDYEKLPLEWEGTEAMLLAVHPEKISRLKKDFPMFLIRDSKIRGEDRYFEFDFEDCLILAFVHCTSGIIFPTIRRNHEQKFEYYSNAIGENFKLTKVENKS